MHEDKERYFPLDRKIELALRIEQEKLEEAILYLPDEWRVGVRFPIFDEF
jgi:hypothetical protein